MGVIHGIGILVAEHIFSECFMKFKNELYKKSIKSVIVSRIEEFNIKYNNTELDTYSFQLAMNELDIVKKIYLKLFDVNITSNKSIKDLQKEISEQAITIVNEYNSKHKRNPVRNEKIFYEYFNDLISTVIYLRKSLLDIKEIITTNIITEKIDSSTKEILDELRKSKNPFATDGIIKVDNLIKLFKLDNAENLLSSIIEEKEHLSDEQQEMVYYLRARILFNKRKYDKLEEIKNKIADINCNSKYIHEINYLLASANNDDNLFSATCVNFDELNYSEEVILLKKINYYINKGDEEKAYILITDQDDLRLELTFFNEAHYYYGILLNNKGDFKKAVFEFHKSLENNENTMYRLLLFYAEYNLIMKKDEYLETTESAKKVLEGLNKIEYIVEYLNEHLLDDYWMHVVNLTVIVDVKEALLIVDKLIEKYPSDVIKSLWADVYIKNDIINNKLLEILEGLWDLNYHNTKNLLIAYIKKSKYSKVIERYNMIEDEKFKKNSVIELLFIKARCEIDGYEAVKEEVIRFSKEYYSEIFCSDIVEIFIKNNDTQSLKDIIHVIKDNIDNMSDIILCLIGNVLNKNRFYTFTRELLTNRLANENVLGVYIKSFCEVTIQSKVTKDSYKIIKELYKNGCKNKSLLVFKAQLELLNDIPSMAVKTLEEYRMVSQFDEHLAYRYVYAKLSSNDIQNMDNEIEMLSQSKYPGYIQIVAMYKERLGLWDEVKDLALEAIYMCNDNIPEELLINHIFLYFRNIDKENTEYRNKEIINNSLVILEKKIKNDDDVNVNENVARNDGSKMIAIHKINNKLFESGEGMNGCENYYSDDIISLVLKTSDGIDTTVTLTDGIEYNVVDVLDINIYLFQYCMSKLKREFPNHNYFLTISAETPEGLLDEMRKTMEIIKENTKKALDLYNYKYKTGIPISYISGKNSDMYTEKLLSMLNMDKQNFYSGNMNFFKNRDYVLTPSSLIILAALGQLDKLRKISSRIYVSEELVKFIKEGIKEAQKFSKIESGHLGVDDTGKLNGYMYDKNDKKERKRFWTDILLITNTFQKVNVDITYNEYYEIMGKYLLDSDISSIEASRDSNKVLICDDLFIRNLHGVITNSNNATNFLGLLISEKLITNGESFDLIMNLSKSNFVYFVNHEILFRLYEIAISMFCVNENNEYIEKFKTIFKNVINKTKYPYYESIVSDFVKIISILDMDNTLIHEVYREQYYVD